MRPFVIRSFPRCGTHMLRTALDRHPQITCHSEVMNKDVTPLHVLRREGAAGIYKRFTGPGEGFIVHGYTGERSNLSQIRADLWPVLQQEQPLVICLERKDLLRRVFSVCTARVTRKWQTFKNEDQRALGAPILETFEVEHELKMAEKSFAASRELFPDAIYINYEDLVENWDENMAMLQKAIGADPQPVRPTTSKQEQRPIQEIVGNYEELRNVFWVGKLGDYFRFAESRQEVGQA